MKTSGGFVYFIEAAEVRLIKIGFAIQGSRARLEALRTASPVELTVLGTIEGGRAFERELHARFAHPRRRGEWFEAAAELLDYIRTHARPGEFGPSARDCRKTVKVLISLSAADVAALDAFAAAIAEPGLPPDRSEAVRMLIRRYRDLRRAENCTAMA